MVPGDTRAQYTEANNARQILNDCEDDLRDWRPEVEEHDAAVEQHAAPIKEKESVTDADSMSRLEETESLAAA